VENQLEDLNTLVEALDRAISREGARLRIPGDPDGNETVGTQQGYLRLGVEFLKAGLKPRALGDSHDIPHIPLDIDYLLTPDSSAPFDFCELVQEVEVLPPVREDLGCLGQLAVAVAAVIGIGLLAIGAMAVLSWIFH
jgi:hypothetical protein